MIPTIVRFLQKVFLGHVHEWRKLKTYNCNHYLFNDDDSLYKVTQVTIYECAICEKIKKKEITIQ